MPYRTKITLGFLVMLLLLVGIGGYALYTVSALGRSGRTTLRANEYSLELGDQMLRALDVMDARAPADPASLQKKTAFQQALTREAGNITEPGERELVDSLTQTLALADRYPQAAADEAASQAISPAYPRLLNRLRVQTQRMMALNIHALSARIEEANTEAAQARDLLTWGVTVAVLLALLLVLSVPAAAVAPLQLLQTAIRHAADHDFTQTIPIESRDEFGAVAQDFNRLLTQLQEFRTSTTAELLTERNRLAAVINTLDEGLLLVDQSRTILLANPVATGLLGLSGKELIGRPAAEVAAHNDLLRAVLRPLDTPAHVGAAAEALPLLNITPPDGGEERHYRLTAHEIVSFNEVRDQLEFAGYILALHNVSDFKKLDQVKSNFLATVSHELKTPLASLSLSLKLLADERVGAAERQHTLAGMRQETQRLQKLVSELLDVARLESGNIALDFRATPIAELVGYATAPVQQQLAQKDLTLIADLPATLPAVRADAEKASWVLLNLLVNAIRYSPEGGSIHLSAQAEGPGMVRFSVRDAGPGIAPEHHERIFQRFSQLPGEAQYRGGSGLGLSIARAFITAQDGRLWVESELGAGSTFHFTLPVG